MTELVYLLEVIITGLLTGMMYSLVAIGYVLIYKSSGVFNFAQGTLLLFAGLTFVKLTEQGVGFWHAFTMTLAIMVIMGILIERFVMRPLANQSLLSLFMATVGLSTFLEGFSQGVWDSAVHGLKLYRFFDYEILKDTPIFVSDYVPWLDILLDSFRIFAAIIVALMITALALFFQYTKTGLSLRAVSDDHLAAMSVGIPLSRVWAVVWAVTGIIGLVAGLLWANSISVSFTLTSVVLKGLPVILVGGLTSIAGAVVGGLLIGVSEKVGEIYIADFFGGQGIENWFGYVVALLFILIRPSGIFGENVQERV